MQKAKKGKKERKRDRNRPFCKSYAASHRREHAVREPRAQRAIVQLIQVARANAALEDRTYITPDDIKKLAGPALAHRMRLDRSAALKGLAADTTSIVQEVLDVVKPPR